MNKEKITGFFYLKIFVIAVIILIFGSLVSKVIYEVTTSKFKQNSFSMLYVAKDTKLIYVDKTQKSALFLALGDLRPYLKGKNAVSASFALGLPINALIIDDNSPQNLHEFASSQNEMRLIFDSKPDFKNLNKFDIYKIISAVRNSNEDNRIELRANILTPDGLKLVEDEFKDSSIINAPYTIQIDNGTTLNGLGNELALILGKEGFNVIAVRTSNEKGNSYVAYPGKKDAYINSLIGLTDFEFREKKVSQAADITIYLGDDLEAMLLQ